MKIRTQADIAELERVPVTERIGHVSVMDLLRHAAQQNGGRVAIRYLDGTGPGDPVRDVTFDQVLRHVTQAANLLRAQGIGSQDTVTLLMPSVPETFFALWGAEIAAVANPVNYFLDASQITAIMKQAGARALIAADAAIFPDIWPKVEAIRAAMPELKVFRVGGGAAIPGVIDYEEACANQPVDRLVAPRPIERDTPAALFHTGIVRGTVADRQWLDDRNSHTAWRAQSQRRARLLGHRRAQPRQRGWRRADHLGGDHERDARRPRPFLAQVLRDRRLDGARRAHPAHRT